MKNGFSRYSTRNRADTDDLRTALLLFAVLLLVPGLAFGSSSADSIREGEVDLHGNSVHYLAAGPQKGRPVLLLHGAKFSSRTWKDLGTLGKLADAGFYAVAIDLPGFGSSARWRADRKTFLAEFIEALKIVRPVVIAPSMSGRFAFPFILNTPERAAGFVPIAAVETPVFVIRLKENPVPVLVVWGTRDRMFPPSTHKALAARFLKSELLQLPNASHAAYLDKPDLFHEGLLEFLKALSGSADSAD